MSETIEFRRPDGQTAPAFLARAAQDDAPGVVVIQEWWGINDQMRGVAVRLAHAGYHALVPDLYRGRLASSMDEANHMMGDLDWPDATHQDMRGAVQHLKTISPKVAILGFCMGGALTIAGAVHTPEADAGVCFYGIPPAELADPAQIKVPMLFHFADHDDWCTPSAISGLETTIKNAGVSYELHTYDAHHAFFNEARPEVFDRVCSDLAWRRSLAFLEQKLR